MWSTYGLYIIIDFKFWILVFYCTLHCHCHPNTILHCNHIRCKILNPKPTHTHTHTHTQEYGDPIHFGNPLDSWGKEVHPHFLVYLFIVWIWWVNQWCPLQKKKKWTWESPHLINISQTIRPYLQHLYPYITLYWCHIQYTLQGKKNSSLWCSHSGHHPREELAKFSTKNIETTDSVCTCHFTS